MTKPIMETISRPQWEAIWTLAYEAGVNRDVMFRLRRQTGNGDKFMEALRAHIAEARRLTLIPGGLRD